jgi:hypothetical protein
MEIMIERKNDISSDRARAMARSLLHEIRTITDDYQKQLEIDRMCDDLYNEEQARGLSSI